MILFFCCSPLATGLKARRSFEVNRKDKIVIEINDVSFKRTHHQWMWLPWTTAWLGHFSSETGLDLWWVGNGLVGKCW
jgi:hypothetical protein